jgi:hypothetical protein
MVESSKVGIHGWGTSHVRLRKAGSVLDEKKRRLCAGLPRFTSQPVQMPVRHLSNYQASRAGRAWRKSWSRPNAGGHSPESWWRTTFTGLQANEPNSKQARAPASRAAMLPSHFFGTLVPYTC